MTKQARAGGALSALRRGADLLAAAEALGRWALPNPNLYAYTNPTPNPNPNPDPNPYPYP